MKLKYLGFLVFALFFSQSVTANAETVSGTVTSVDGQKVTILRSDNNESATIYVRDRDSLARLSSGSRITLDANRRSLGGLETQSVDVSSALSTADTSNSRASSATGSYSGNVGSGMQNDRSSTSTLSAIGLHSDPDLKLNSSVRSSGDVGTLSNPPSMKSTSSATAAKTSTSSPSPSLSSSVSAGTRTSASGSEGDISTASNGGASAAADTSAR